MPGAGPPPKENRIRRARPTRGEWRAAPGLGWQHDPEPPSPPKGLGAAARTAWATWMASWVASYWEPHDLPLLRLTISLYDKVERGSCTAAERGELRLLLDGYGLTKKGQQDRRWRPPSETQRPSLEGLIPSRYAHLTVIDSTDI